eukprot:485821-Amphidinium_carterae.1
MFDASKANGKSPDLRSPRTPRLPLLAGSGVRLETARRLSSGLSKWPGLLVHLPHQRASN